MFVFNKQVSYDNDNEWGEWNMSAKRRILMETNNGPTGAPYFINQDMSGGSALL